MQLQAGLINSEIININIYYEHEDIIKKGVPNSLKVYKL